MNSSRLKTYKEGRKEDHIKETATTTTTIKLNLVPLNSMSIRVQKRVWHKGSNRYAVADPGRLVGVGIIFPRKILTTFFLLIRCFFQ